MNVRILNFDDAGDDTPPRPPRYDAERLTRGGRQAEIALQGKVYTLRITRHGKLLLTK